MESSESPSPEDLTDDSLAKIILGMQSLYFQADTIFSELETTSHALMLDNIEAERQEVTAFAATWRESTLQQRVLSVLETPSCVFAAKHYCPKMWDTLTRWTSGRYKARMAQLGKGKFARDLDLQISCVLAHIARVKNIHDIPPLMIQRGISRLHYGTSKVDWRMQTKQRLVPSKHYIEGCLDSVQGWIPKTRWEVSDMYSIIVEDNKEWREPSKGTVIDPVTGQITVDPVKHTTTSES